MRRFPKWLLALPIAALALLVGGPFVYINFIKEEAPERLSFTEAAPDAAATTSTAGAVAASGVDGAWKITSGSTAGYRVKEVFAGQSTEAAGRTSNVTGTMEIAGTTVKTASIVVDLASVTSDDDRRDNQFRGRIMAVADYPTANFDLTEPLDFTTLPADGTTITVPATGTLTLHGTQKAVRVDLRARRDGATIEVLGTIPVLFDDYGIPNPSNQFVSTEDKGEIEFLVIFAPA